MRSKRSRECTYLVARDLRLDPASRDRCKRVNRRRWLVSHETLSGALWCFAGSDSDKGRYARRRERQSHESVRCNQPRQPVEESTIFHNRGLRARTFSLERFLLVGGPIRFPRSLDGAVGSKCAERLMLPTRRVLFLPWAALKSTVAEPLCVLSMDAQAVGSAVGIPLEGESESLACHRNTEH
jgi:hypothetical protein